MWRITSLLLSGVPAFSDGVPRVNGSPVPSSPSSQLAWGDFDGDGLADIYAIGDEDADRLFRNDGTGSFVERTFEAGLAGLAATRQALWEDIDRDGALDLYLVAERAERCLFWNRGDGTFEDITWRAGLSSVASVSEAKWVDYDADGYPDLLLRTADGEKIFHNSGDKRFEAVTLGLPVSSPSNPTRSFVPRAEVPRGVVVPGQPGTPISVDPPHKPNPREPRAAIPSPNPGFEGSHMATTAVVSQPMRVVDSALDSPLSEIPPTESSGAAAQGPTPGAAYCAPAIKDQAGGCLEASSIPTLGLLYPMTQDLFVSSSGNVGIGTTSPAAKVDVVKSGVRNDVAGGVTMYLVNSGSSATGNLVSIQSGDTGVAGVTFGDQTDGDLASVRLVNGVTDRLSLANHGEKLHILENGNVGIGTATPNALLDLFGPSASVRIQDSENNDPFLRFVDSSGGRIGTIDAVGGQNELRITADTGRTLTLGADGGQNIFVTTSGNVGIGTASPAARVEVVTSGVRNDVAGGVTMYVVNSGSSTTGNLVSIQSGDTGVAGVTFGDQTDGDLASVRLYNGVTDRLTLANHGEHLHVLESGNVGIGTATPARKLSVLGEIESMSGGFRFPDGTLQTTASEGGGSGGITSVNGAVGPALSIVGSGGASVSTNGNTITISASSSASLQCLTVVGTYGPPTGSSTIDLSCPSGYSAVLARCNSFNGFVVFNGSETPPPPGGTPVNYLIPSASAATGVHCFINAGEQQAAVRCCRF